MRGWLFSLFHWAAYSHPLVYKLRYVHWRLQVKWWVHQLKKGNPAAPHVLWALYVEDILQPGVLK